MPTDPSATAPTPLRVLADAAGALARGTDLDGAIGDLLAGASAVLGADTAALFVQDPEGGSLQLVAHQGLAAEAATALEAEVAEDPGHPIATAALEARPRIGRSGTTADGAALTAADVPVVVARDGIDLPLGVLSFAWTGDRTLGEDERAALAATADLIGLAIDRVRLATLVHERSEWIERLAQTDALTGLANARLLDRVLDLEVARAGRQDGELSLVLFDLDDFADFNERAGREAGDDVLRGVAAVLAESVRLVDTVARTGADEFAVVAPGSAGATVARRVIDAATAVGGSARPVSVSAGVARFPADGATAAELLEAARRALAAAKADGGGGLAAASGSA